MQTWQESYLQKSIHDCAGILVNRCHERVRRAGKTKLKISICLLTTCLKNIIIYTYGFKSGHDTKFTIV